MVIMSMITRSQTPESALAHVLTILGEHPFKPIFKEAGIEDIYDLLSTLPSDLKEISILDDEANLFSLKIAQVSRIQKIKEWYEHQSAKGLGVWFLLTEKILLDFITNPPSPVVPDPVISSSNSTSNSSQSTPSGRTVLYGVKRNMSDYPKLRDDKLWLSFNRNFKVIAATHAVDEVLDSTYVPPSDEEADFNAKNTFIYSVLSQSLLTAKSRIPIRNHESTTNGQAAYRDLVQSYAEGTMASLNADQLETALKNFKADKSWTKPLATFLSTWSLKIADLETVRDKAYSDDDKRDLLVKAVTPNETLYMGVTTAKTVEATVSAVTGEKTISFERFYNIILDRALTLDSTNKSLRPRAGNPSRQANQTNQHGSSPAFQRVQKLPDFIPTAKWNSMSKSEQLAIQKKRKAQRRANKTGTLPTPSVPPVPNTVPVPAPSVPVPPAAPPSSSSTVSTMAPSVSGATTQINSTQTTSQANAQRLLALTDSQPQSIVLNGRTYTANVTYRVHRSVATNTHSLSLIDRGANGGLSGGDVWVLSQSTSDFVDVKGIADAEVKNLPLSSVAGVLQSDKGPIVGVFNQYAHYGEGISIHSPVQFEHFGLQVDDKCSALSPTSQTITTPEGYVIPLRIHHGLVYMDMYPPSYDELARLPHVMMTRDAPWDPSCMDNDGPCDELPPASLHVTRRDGQPFQPSDYTPMSHDDNLRCCLRLLNEHITVYKPKSILPYKPDYKLLRPPFGWASVDRIHDTIHNTTQWYKAEGCLPMRHH